MVQIPVPKLVVFYNGTEEKADDTTLELKEAFPQELRDGVSDIDVRVRMLNINKGRNKAIMQACGPLMEYAWLVEEIRENSLHMDIERAVDCAIDSVPENFELRKFLIGHKAEVKDMCITEYNEAETMRMIELAGEKRGEERGKKIGEKQGEDKLGRLIEELLSKGRTEDVQRVATDKNARVILYKEFNIE